MPDPLCGRETPKLKESDAPPRTPKRFPEYEIPICLVGPALQACVVCCCEFPCCWEFPCCEFPCCPLGPARSCPNSVLPSDDPESLIAEPESPDKVVLVI